MKQMIMTSLKKTNVGGHVAFALGAAIGAFIITPMLFPEFETRNNLISWLFLVLLEILIIEPIQQRLKQKKGCCS